MPKVQECKHTFAQLIDLLADLVGNNTNEQGKHEHATQGDNQRHDAARAHRHIAVRARVGLQ